MAAPKEKAGEYLKAARRAQEVLRAAAQKLAGFPKPTTEDKLERKYKEKEAEQAKEPLTKH